MLQDSLWKTIVLVATLLSFAGIGLVALINPDRFMLPIQKGGEMLTEWNRFGIRLSGVVFAAGALYLLYTLLRD